MSGPISRRSFTTVTAGIVLGSAANLAAAEEKQRVIRQGLPETRDQL